ncbi:hypothetical protein BLA29_010538, partial [Euroglyphus maynei]
PTSDDHQPCGIIEFPRSITGTIGSKASFTVETDTDIDKVEWLHDGRAIDSDLQTQSTSNRQLKLTVSSIREKDVGQYSVRLTNKKGVTTTLAFALVIINE